MKSYAVYDSTGNILKWGFCANRDLENQAKVVIGEKVMEIDVVNNLDLTHRVGGEQIKRLEKKPKILE